MSSGPSFAPDPAGFDPTEGCGKVEFVEVDARRSGFEPVGLGDSVSLVGGPHRAGEAMLRVVGQRQRVLDARVINDAQHWPEDSLLGESSPLLPDLDDTRR